MADARIEGLTVEDAINVIKQKHFTELTPNDYAFLRARQDYLSEADKRIYLEGEDPVEVLRDSGAPLTREERIINENRPLQERQQTIADAKDAAMRAEASILAEKTPEEREEARKALVDARKAKAQELRESADMLEEVNAESDKSASEEEKTDERKALEAEAESLGITFKANTKDETLAKKIAEAKGE